ncbi:DapH/DapD/GlmU-related protein [Peribacillus frigoritolerans]|uniref:DapH/DapD/GlmU-related protein n=1 Tax=Peribacillus castrilensis TaxID=2897690 RepID=UPI00384D5B5A
MDGSDHNLSIDNPSICINTKGDSKPIIIKDNVWIGANSPILPGVTIGEGSVIVAGSIVTKNIPAMVIAGGNPAK